MYVKHKWKDAGRGSPKSSEKSPSLLNFVHNKNPHGIVWDLRGASEVRGSSLNF
jgi:hypothetical protein